MVMMLGELDFGGIFVPEVDHDGVNPTLEVPYPTYTLICFLMFTCFMSIIIVNLMVNEI